MPDDHDGDQSPNVSEKWMVRNFRPLAVALAVVMALSLTIARQGSEGGRLRVLAQKVLSATPERDGQKYDAAALTAFRRVLMRVTDSYVDPERIHPRKMLLSALHSVEQEVAEVLIQESKNKKKVTVRVQDAERTFDISEVDSPWSLSSMVKKIMRFIQPRLDPSTKARDVEYAAVNGMLSTLDPHSVLLSPDVYDEMKLSTRGEFGGLGIVISMIQGTLTVMKTMKGTPAAAAGLKSCDKILKIGKESTVNMTLTQAVSRLRGAPGSKVTITIQRQGWKNPARKTLTRDVIKVDSVSSRLLANHVGYLRLTSFQGNSLDDVRNHLKKLRKKGMKALVLDLRSNPGGLLDQAIRISDLFIDAGTLVTTVSHAGRRREEKRAKRANTEGRYPIAVLVNGSSASASEIVAGALKQLDRGVVVGRRTFGKGTVQVLYDNDDGSALKLTIAQYLTPGDVSIQSVGVMPDVLTEPVVIRERIVRLRRRDDALPREENLRSHLTHRNTRKEKPAYTVHYLATIKKPKKGEPKEKEPSNLCLFPDRRCRPSDDDTFVEDAQIRVARHLMSRAKHWRRSDILAGSKALFSKVRDDEEARIAKALRKLGVDWTVAQHIRSKRTVLAANSNKLPITQQSKQQQQMPKLSVSVSTSPRGGVAHACRSFKLTVKVRNVGKGSAYRLAGVTESSNKIFAGHDVVIGHLDPGETRSWTVPIKVRDAATRLDEVTIKFKDAAGTKYEPHRFQISVEGVERPVFAYSYQLIDDIQGNRDGRPQRGEKSRLFVKVRNTGKGVAFRTVTTLKNLSGVGIFVRKGRFVLGRLAPGQTKTASFTFDVEPSFAQDKFKVELSVLDEGLRETVSEKLEFSIAKKKTSIEKSHGVVRVIKPTAPFLAWPQKNAPTVGYARNGASFKTVGQFGRWYRVLATKRRPAFISAENVKSIRGRAHGRFFERWQVTPPKLSLDVPTYATKSSSVKLGGSVIDENRVADVFIFVRNPDAKITTRKVFYQSNRKGKDPKKMRFSAKIPLWLGANYIIVNARENNDVVTQEVLVISRYKDDEHVRRIKSAAR